MTTGPEPLSREDVRARHTLDVTIDDYGFTGEGFVRLEDGWLSVRGAMPGERVTVELEPNQREAARRIFARVVGVLKPHPQRSDPLCGRADICHGCQMRHMTMAEEVRWKSTSMVEILERYAHIPAEEQPQMQLWSPDGLWRGDAERMRSNVTYRLTEDGPVMGLRSPKVDGLISMASCPALIESLLRLLRGLEARMIELHARGVRVPDASASVGLVRVRVSSPVHGRGMLVFEVQGVEAQSLEEALGHEDLGWLAPLLEHIGQGVPALVSVFVHLRDAEQTFLSRGPRRMRLPVAGVSLEVGPEDWFHATLRPAEVLYEHLLEWLELRPHERFLDIGCGVGTISVLASPHAQEVLGLDANRSSVETAQLNAFEHNCDNVEIVAGSWERGLRGLRIAGRTFDVATINPMREPLGERALTYVGALGVKRLVYLGPSAVSAAKDIALLRGLGWRLDAVCHAMLHPATYHTMLVAKMVRDE